MIDRLPSWLIQIRWQISRGGIAGVIWLIRHSRYLRLCTVEIHVPHHRQFALGHEMHVVARPIP